MVGMAITAGVFRHYIGEKKAGNTTEEFEMLEFYDEVKLVMLRVMPRTAPCGSIAAFEENEVAKRYSMYQTIYAVFSSK